MGICRDTAGYTYPLSKASHRDRKECTQLDVFRSDHIYVLAHILRSLATFLLCKYTALGTVYDGSFRSDMEFHFPHIQDPLVAQGVVAAVVAVAFDLGSNDDVQLH